VVNTDIKAVMISQASVTTPMDQTDVGVAAEVVDKVGAPAAMVDATKVTKVAVMEVEVAEPTLVATPQIHPMLTMHNSLWIVSIIIVRNLIFTPFLVLCGIVKMGIV